MISAGTSVRAATLVLDTDTGALTNISTGQRGRLPRHQFHMLAMLMRAAGKVVSHQDVIAAKNGPNSKESATVAVNRLRKLLASIGADRSLIVTVRGWGWKFDGEAKHYAIYMTFDDRESLKAVLAAAPPHAMTDAARVRRALG